MAMLRHLGADHTIACRVTGPVEKIPRLTNGAGVNVAIAALVTRHTFERCLHALKSGATMSSLGMYSDKLGLPRLYPIVAQKRFAAPGMRDRLDARRGGKAESDAFTLPDDSAITASALASISSATP